MWLYSLAAFLAAFLLFQVQMLLGKFILPWHGGAPAVWTTCMLFFQSALLVGYGYAHGLAAKTGPVAQRNLHLALIALSLAVLAVTALVWGRPLLPDAGWQPTGQESPVAHILVLLGATVGLPFVTLAATAPLTQHWFSRTHREHSPYRLYALSNAGSLAGLLSYPFVVEVFVPLRAQAVWWTAGYVLFALLLGVLAMRAAHVAAVTPATAEPEAAPPSSAQRWLWFGLPACASVLLLAITNQLSQEIAVVPFLWVLPLALYLLSFILCFGDARWYPRELYMALIVPALVLVTLTLQRGVLAPLAPQVLIYAAALFVFCMVCHGELVRLRPTGRYLTSFYLIVSAGGAAGGLFVGFFAPLWFQGYWELSFGLVGSALLLGVLLWRDRSSPLHHSPRAALVLLLASALLVGFAFSERLSTWEAGPLTALAAIGAVAWLSVTRASWRRAALVTALLVLAGVHAVFVVEPVRDAMQASRNFFGVQQVTAHRDTHDEIVLRLTHGRTVHGAQYLSRARRLEPTGYYLPQSGVGLAIQHHPRRVAGQSLRVGVVGLGVGVLAAYGREGDVFRFYEINPDIIRLASAPDALFSFIRLSPAAIEIVPGDARLSLEREPPQHYQLLVLDAFNSGSIPLHLLTREAFAVYRAHLDPRDGVLAVHVSNRYLDLVPVLAAQASALGLEARRLEHDEPDSGASSLWVLLASRAALLPAEGERPAAISRSLWTDDYTNLLGALAWARPAGLESPDARTRLDDDARLLDLLR